MYYSLDYYNTLITGPGGFSEFRDFRDFRTTEGTEYDQPGERACGREGQRLRGTREAPTRTRSAE